MGRPEPPAWHGPFHELNDVGMLDLEPPDHTRLRRLVLKAFTPRTVEAMRSRIQAIVDGLIDDMGEAGEADLIAQFVEPLPVTVIAELLGIPAADRHLLRPWSADFCLMYELDPPEASARKAVQASIEFGAYLRDLLAERRRRPGDDLISALAAVVDDGDTLTETELIGTCVLLLNAGHEASVNGAGNGWWTLFRHPDALARLRAEPDLLPTAIEELLRYDTPLSLFERWVLEPIEVDGVEISRGEEVALLFGAANRDPDAFVRPGRSRPRARSQPVPVVRGRDPLLPGRAAREDGARRSRSGRCCGGGRGSSSSRRRAGSRPSCCAGSSRSGSGSSGGAACATSRSATRTPSAPRSGPPSAGRSGWSRRSGRPTPHGWSWWPTSGSTVTPRLT